MTESEFESMAKRVTAELAGKTIAHASWAICGMGCSLTLHFTDGSEAEITPEHDEGFVVTHKQEDANSIAPAILKC